MVTQRALVTQREQKDRVKQEAGQDTKEEIEA
jgi:hypothetical protein